MWGVVSVFESGVEAGHRTGMGRFAASVDVGRDFGGRHARSQEEAGLAKKIGHALGAFARLVIPILLLATLARRVVPDVSHGAAPNVAAP